MGGVDLNLIGRYSELFREVAREHRQNAFRSTHGFSTESEIRSAMRRLDEVVRAMRSNGHRDVREAETHEGSAMPR
jgi:hypothetical protein